MNIEALLLTLKAFLWIFMIGGFLVIILTLGSEKPEKKHLRSAYKSILIGFFGLWIFPFLSTFIKGPTPGISVEDNLANLASKSPFYSILSQLPMWDLGSLLVIIAILCVLIWYLYKIPKSTDSKKDNR